ncbi:DNA-binding transcriptional MerR regulator [Nocardia transvalensis]|uniref:DNA-binding transcriptional MerR regulator n=1 Tax=Nocardia transvalensis TaxID=37333 RepID=A0A7W9PB55_9NOCA|nr:MerR family transcriptional regulator [Nocardia transvalensis]MBB5912866.1 DNA-binding transcriptional MerR regulator [Nocardia transvalensis]
MTSGSEFTIDELARESGMTVRSLRAYQERGLLPPPRLQGRTGFYGAQHLDRVRIISRLMDRGIKLSGIRELLDAWDRGEDLGDVLGVSVEPNAAAPAAPQPPTPTTEKTIPAIELVERYRDVPNGLARVVAVGLYEPFDATTYRETDPQLVRLADRLADAGTPLGQVLDELERLRADCDHIARRFADLFENSAVKAFQQSGRSAHDIAEFTDHVAAVRTLPGRVSSELIERFLARYLEHATRDLEDTSTGRTG